MANVLVLQDLIDLRLTPKLGYIQNIEIASPMLCQPTGVSTRVQCPYGNWINTPLVRKNGTIITPDSYDVTTGTIDIASLVAGDDVHVVVKFKYFSNSDLQAFFKLALSSLNNAPPYSTYTLNDSTTGDTATYPIDAENYLVQAAYKEAIDTLMMDLMGWRARIIFAQADTLAQFLQAKSSEISSYLSAVALTVKGRRNLQPHSVSAGRWKTPAQVNDATWQQYTVIRA